MTAARPRSQPPRYDGQDWARCPAMTSHLPRLSGRSDETKPAQHHYPWVVVDPADPSGQPPALLFA